MRQIHLQGRNVGKQCQRHNLLHWASGLFWNTMVRLVASIWIASCWQSDPRLCPQISWPLVCGWWRLIGYCSQVWKTSFVRDPKLEQEPHPQSVHTSVLPMSVTDSLPYRQTKHLHNNQEPQKYSYSISEAKNSWGLLWKNWVLNMLVILNQIS